MKVRDKKEDNPFTLHIICDRKYQGWSLLEIYPLGEDKQRIEVPLGLELTCEFQANILHLISLGSLGLGPEPSDPLFGQVTDVILLSVDNAS